LLRLDDTNARAELKRLTLREDRLSAIGVRLEAETNEADRLVFPSDQIQRAGSDADLADVLKRQQDTFIARQNNLRSDLAVLQDGVDALDQMVKGMQQQKQSTAEQVSFYQQELDAKTPLLKDGEIRKSDVLALQRAKASGEGEIGRLDGDIGDANERIARTREQMIGTRSLAVKAAIEQLNDVRAEQNDVRERIRSATATLDRVEIVAPVRGVVVKLRYRTPGGVVEAGKSIMEIVPIDDELLIEARIRPQDITDVRRGQKASVRLSALSVRVTPTIEGEVVYLSADALPDDKHGQYSPSDQYVVRIRLDPIRDDALRLFAPTPGMPAEVYIRTGERTFFQYITKPLRDSMARAFRER
jgi:HlyD family type I secretion membrane fusion protein